MSYCHAKGNQGTWKCLPTPKSSQEGPRFSSFTQAGPASSLVYMMSPQLPKCVAGGRVGLGLRKAPTEGEAQRSPVRSAQDVSPVRDDELVLDLAGELPA